VLAWRRVVTRALRLAEAALWCVAVGSLLGLSLVVGGAAAGIDAVRRRR